jgi:hypothetical protein
MKKKLETIFSLMNQIKAKITTGKFSEATLEDGTVLTWEGDLAPGVAVFVVDGENNVPAPEGTHMLTGDFAGKSIVLDAEGIIVEVIEEDGLSKDGKGDEGTAEAKTEVFSKKEILHFAQIMEVSKWSMTVDQDTIEVGTALTYSYTYGETTDVYSVMAGEYETAEGKRFLVDGSGVVRMFLDEATPTDTAQVQASNEEMSKAVNEAKEISNGVFNVVEQVSAIVGELSAQIEKQALEFAEIKGRFEKVANAPSDKTKENERFSRIESSEFNATQKRLLDSLNK